MRNVIINKIVKYVLTEDQMRGLWKRLKKETPYDELSDEDIIELAKRIMKKASHSELEQFTVDSPWRLPNDVTGKLLAQDDTDPTEHIELIDTDHSDTRVNDMIIDRLLKLKCQSCAFEFYSDNLDEDISKLSCPKCGGELVSSPRSFRALKKDQ